MNYNSNKNCNNKSNCFKDSPTNCCHDNHHKDDNCCKSLKCICDILEEYKSREPSYAAFWQTNFVTVNLNNAFPFNFSGPNTPDISLLNPTTIKVNKSGVYYISYKVLVDISANTNPSIFVTQRISLYVNGLVQPNSQTSFGIQILDVPACLPISGDAVISIPANASLQLKNDGNYTGSSAIRTCDNGVNAVTSNIMKIG